MVMIDPELFKSEWFVEMPVDARYMYLYLLVNASPKTGIFEWNERMINFCANTKTRFSKEDVIRIYDGRIVPIPGHESSMIIVDYLRFNWLKDGRPLNPEGNPLHRSIVKELSRFGLTVESLNEMSKHKISVKQDGDKSDAAEKASLPSADAENMFESFWKDYPGPRKQDKRKCHDKFIRVIGTDPDKSVSMFNRIMDGLAKWKRCDTWTKNGGQFICAPLVWLNNERWDAEIKESANGIVRSKEATGLF